MKNDKLLEYTTKDGKKLYALTDRGPVGDGYYFNPANRYIGLANRPAMRSCGGCAMVGMCQYCANRWPTQNTK